MQLEFMKKAVNDLKEIIDDNPTISNDTVYKVIAAFDVLFAYDVRLHLSDFYCDYDEITIYVSRLPLIKHDDRSLHVTVGTSVGVNTVVESVYLREKWEPHTATYELLAQDSWFQDVLSKFMQKFMEL